MPSLFSGRHYNGKISAIYIARTDDRVCSPHPLQKHNVQQSHCIKNEVISYLPRRTIRTFIFNRICNLRITLEVDEKLVYCSQSFIYDTILNYPYLITNVKVAVGSFLGPQ